MEDQTHLPSKLKETVSKVLEILGEVIKEQEGNKFFAQIEAYRLLVKKIRPLSHEKSISYLTKLEKDLSKKSTAELNKINKAFSLYLELCNATETAYRTVKLKERASLTRFSLSPKSPRKVSFVFTAHPTEARSPQMMRLLSQVRKLLIEYIQFNQKNSEDKIRALIGRALKTEMAPHVKPSVQDEARQVSTIALRDEVLNTIKIVSGNNIQVEMRSWAGGDKDGNPFVSEIEFRASLNLSRKILVKHFLGIIDAIKKYSLTSQDQISVNKVEKLISSIETLKNSDGIQVQKLQLEISRLKIDLPEVQDLKHLLKSFPALVMPLEFREEAAVIREASLEAPRKKSQFAILRMLKELGQISKGTSPLFYVRGLILSQLETPNEVKGAIDLQNKLFKKIIIPVIPLLETKESLLDYKKLISPLFHYSNYKKTLKTSFSNKLEIMLGYSDTAKVLGSLPSRVLLFEVVGELNKFVSKNKAELLLFHGSGGSVDRGGGPIKEQVSWIPSELVSHYKATIQGEMIVRTLATSEILLRNLEVITSASKSKIKREAYWTDVEAFTTLIEEHYHQLINNQKFLDIVGVATPYSYLKTLKIGSRPSKRSKGDGINVQSLRAIPWVLCWTQTRALLQTWWGIGSSWEKLSKKQRKSIKVNYHHHPVLSSFVKLLGFTLEKIKPSILKLYLRELGGDLPYSKEFELEFLKELNKTKKFFYEITGEKSFTYFRPWLGDSIVMRSPIIHILNIIQLQAIKRKEDHLLRETVTGISSGMLTTG